MNSSTASNRARRAHDDPAQRIFLAIWPDASIRAQISDLADLLERNGVAGRRVPDRNYHITVAFLGALRPPQVTAVINLVGRLECPRIELIFDKVSFRSRSRIIWMSCREVPVGLQDFHRRLRSHLARIGLVTERREFAPHITLYRKAARRPRVKTEPLQWPLEGICAVRSVLAPDGARYEILQRTPAAKITYADGQYM